MTYKPRFRRPVLLDKRSAKSIAVLSRNSQGRLDLILQRGSALAQILLSIVTVGTLYFTVVPLYQKAVLEEAVAKREVELKDVNARLEQGYARVRLFALREYTTYASAECSGLLVAPPESGEIARFGKEFEIDVEECLVKNLDIRALRDLRLKDLEVFSRIAANLGARLNAERRSAFQRFNDIPKAITEAQSQTIELDGQMANWDGLLRSIEANGVSIPSRAAQRHQMVVSALQMRVLFDYEKTVRDEVLALRNTKWE